MENNRLKMALSCMKVALKKLPPKQKVNFNKGTKTPLAMSYEEALEELETLMNYLETQNRYGTCNQCRYFDYTEEYPHFGECTLSDNECHEYDSCNMHELRRK